MNAMIVLRSSRARAIKLRDPSQTEYNPVLVSSARLARYKRSRSKTQRKRKKARTSIIEELTARIHSLENAPLRLYPRSEVPLTSSRKASREEEVSRLNARGMRWAGISKYAMYPR